MKAGRIATWLFLAVLVGACAAPLALLLAFSRDAVRAWEPRIVRTADGGVLLGQILPQDRLERSEGVFRVLLGGGEDGRAAVLVPESAVVSVSDAPDAWVVERDDGPALFGRPLHARGPGWRIEDPDSVAAALRDMPGRLRTERERLVAAVRSSPGSGPVEGAAAEAWERWVARDDSTEIVLDRGDGVPVRARLSGVAAAWRAGELGARASARRLVRFLLTPPGSWGGGGIRPALASVASLALMAGLFSGLFGVSAALWIHARGSGEAWIVRGRALVSNLAGVPGVVWGVAGAGLLVHGLGPLLDGFFGTSLWSGGGLLWSGATLGALASPIVTALSLEELDRIPGRWREIAWTCGATRFQVVQRVVVPTAWRGLLAAVLSGMARAAGETAPLLLTGAVHAFGGLSLGGDGLVASLAGGFLHPGVLALDSPWTGGDLERGQPMVALMLLLLSAFCVGLDLAASRLRHGGRRAPTEEGI